MKKILHLSCDEKFIDMGINVFELAYPSCNKLVLIKSDNDVKHVTFNKRKIISKKSLSSASKKSSFWFDVDVVVLHSLFTFDLHIPENIRVVWLGFGYDYYDLISENGDELLSSRNIAFLDKVAIKQVGLKSQLKKLLKAVSFYEELKNRKRRKIIEKIDIFCPVLVAEYHAINWPSNKRPKLMDWNYGTMEDNWAKDGITTLKGNNVLLGNSATKTCNHIDGIDLINQLKSFNDKLIIPLSYGDKRYKELLKEYLKINFEGDVQLLEDFMVFDEYKKIISTCSLAVMPHKRQQGLGNILMLLNLGAKVFLDKDNQLYKYLKEEGFIVYKLEEITLSNFQSRLNKEKVEINRKLLYKIWGRQSIVEKTIAVVECELR